MADSTQDTSSLDCIPEIYLERRSAQSTHHSLHGRVQPRGEGVDETGEQPTAQESNDDLVKEGFIPYLELKLHHLPEAIRTQENLERILSIGERVVCVNNNQLSEERNLEPEMKMPGVALKGTGFVLNMGSRLDMKVLAVCTNRHVMYNLEEIERSTVDFNFDSYRGENQIREMERTQRGNGLWAPRHNSKMDFCITVYSLDSKSSIAFEQRKLSHEFLLYSSAESAATSEASLGKGIVCVISHPLGRFKHVSFGKIVTCRPQNNTFLHDAPTKPGSSGAPIIVFGTSALQVPPESLFYHEGVDLKTKLKKGHVEVNFGCVIEPRLISLNQTDSMILGKSKRIQWMNQFLHDLSYDEVRLQAQITIQSLRLGAFFPIFAAFILQPEKYCARVLTLPSAPPCQSLSERDVELSDVDTKHLTWCLRDWAHHSPSLFPPQTSETGELGSPQSPSLTTEAPCWCQAIVEAVVHTSRSDKDTGVFLRPDAVCGDFRQNPSWPWSLDRCGGSSGPGREPMLKQCLLKECLDVFRGQTCGKKKSIPLLVLVRKANDMVRQSASQTPQVQHGCPGVTRTTTATSAHTKSDNQRPEVITAGNVSISELAQQEVAFDVFSILCETALNMSNLSSWIQWPCFCSYKGKFKPSNPQDDCVKNFDKAVEFISHLQHHHVHDHPDSPRSQGLPEPGPRCECGRPSFTDVMKASTIVCSMSMDLLESRPGARGEQMERFPKTPLPDGRCYDSNATKTTSLVFLPMKSEEICTSTPGSPCSLEQFLSGIDSMDNFRNCCDLISVGLTSLEVFLFNSRSLLRQYRQHLFPLYISGPVSVFGRPGRWAGGHTPQEVKNTAWKLIRAACAESRFGRECLEVLERDTARREKLIDLYVDMKQLKFSGDVEEDKMTVEYMRFVYVQERMEGETLSVTESAHDNPTYFVLKTFLKLFPIPSWDRAWQRMQLLYSVDCVHCRRLFACAVTALMTES